MDLIANLATGFAVSLTPANLGFCFIGALIGTLQTPLGTLWVWLAFSEVPTAATLAGGALVMAAVVGDIAIRRRAAPDQAGSL